MIGFFAKQIVLYSSTHAGYYFMSIVAIVVSVISASYYLKIIQVMYFNSSQKTLPFESSTIPVQSPVTNIHSTAIAILTMAITFFVFQPILLLNSCHLLALSLFYY